MLKPLAWTVTMLVGAAALVLTLQFFSNGDREPAPIPSEIAPTASGPELKLAGAGKVDVVEDAGSEKTAANLDGLLKTLGGEDREAALEALRQLSGLTIAETRRRDVVDAVLAILSAEGYDTMAASLQREIAVWTSLQLFRAWVVTPLGNVLKEGAPARQRAMVIRVLIALAPDGTRELAGTLPPPGPDSADLYRAVVVQLGSAPTGDPSVLGILADAMGISDDRVKQAALIALSAHGAAGAGAVDGIGRVIEEAPRRGRLRLEAARTLWHVTGETGPILSYLDLDGTGGIGQQSEAVRRRLFQTLTEMGPSAVSALVSLVEDPDRALHAPAALAALAGMRDAPIQAVRQLLGSSESRVAHAALAGIRPLGRRGHQLLPEVVAFLERPESATRVSAVDTIAALGAADPATAKHLLVALSDPDVQVRIAAARAFAGSPAWSKFAEEDLRGAELDTSRAVREHVVRALSLLETPK